MRWTSDAEDLLRDYFASRSTEMANAEIDPAEVGADIRCHVEEEVAERGGEIVTADALRRVLTKIGGVEVESPVSPPPVPAPKSVGVARAPGTIRRTQLFAFLAIYLPAGTLVLEMLTGFCAMFFFDPISTWWHVGLAATVPLANALAFWFLVRRETAPPRSVILLNGIAITVGLYYSALYLPLMVPAVPALIFAGLGLLPMAVIFACWGSILAARRTAELGAAAPANRRALLWGGIAAGGLAIFALEGPKALGRTWLLMATSPERATQENGIALLRAVRPDQTLLLACYESSGTTRSATDTMGWAFGLARKIRSEAARDIYYRVTGTVFNAAKPPRAALLGRRGEQLDGFRWDSDRGGDSVSARIADLDLVTSRVDSHIEPASALGYTEWTLVFRNRTPSQQEARFQALLPPAGVVSRLTLWVDGEPREAAFNTREKVKTAYKNIVAQRRDPVLVTTTGPDRVLIQCFPVPPDGGEMKIRVGITAPLDRGLDPGRLWLPQFLARNFSFDDALEHSVWVQSTSPELVSPLGSTLDDSGDAGVGQLQMVLSSDDFQSSRCFVDCAPAADPAPRVWARDPFADTTESVLTRVSNEVTQVPVDHFVIVVDGSESLKPHRGSIATALAEVADEIDFELLVAHDEVRRLGGGAQAVQALENVRMGGGIDDTPALLDALRLAREKKNSAIIWLHGPQPIAFAKTEALAQHFERSTRPVPFYAIPLANGENRVLESLYKLTAIRCGLRLADPAEDLPKALAALHSGATDKTYSWERSPAPSTDAETPEVWDQLARYWAFDDVMRRFAQAGWDQTASPLAARYQLVTPFSGAVVLESAKQFADAGLNAIDAATAPSIPVVPEPSSAMLVAMALAASILRRHR